MRAIRAYKGGSTSAMHALRIVGASGVDTVVLRRYVLEDLNLEEPDIAAREARTLQLLSRFGVETPTLLAVDPTGDDAGVPAVLMTRVPGRVDWSPMDFASWLRRLAETLQQIHEAPIGVADGVQSFVPYPPPSWDAPSWLKDRKLWIRALDVFHGPCLDPDRVSSIATSTPATCSGGGTG